MNSMNNVEERQRRLLGLVSSLRHAVASLRGGANITASLLLSEGRKLLPNERKLILRASGKAIEGVHVVEGLVKKYSQKTGEEVTGGE